jgi:hypothetical protein
LRRINHIPIVRQAQDVECGLSLDRQDASGEVRIGVEMLMDDGAWDYRKVASLPFVTLSVVNVVTMTFQDV